MPRQNALAVGAAGMTSHVQVVSKDPLVDSLNVRGHAIHVGRQLLPSHPSPLDPKPPHLHTS